MPSPIKEFSKLLKGVPAGAWVALSHDQERVISFGADMGNVLADAQKKGESNPVILRAPSLTASLVL